MIITVPDGSDAPAPPTGAAQIPPVPQPPQAEVPQPPAPADSVAGGAQEAAGASMAQPGTGTQTGPADHGPASVEAADPAAADPPAAPERRAIAGQVSSFSPEGWPVVDGVAIRLEGIGVLDPGQGRPVASWITAHGGHLACTATTPGAYRCLTRQKLDLSQVILLNGAAKAGTDAGPLYRDAEAGARAARRGVWR